jgi:hypothetical protein
MKNFLWLTLAFALVLGYSASGLQARGGGHGGGHHGGGGHHHSGGGHHSGHHGSHHASHHHDHHHDHHHHHAHYAHHNRPFTPGWYGNHPNAWHHGYGNWWAGTTFGAAATWLGLSAANPLTYAYPSAVPTVYTSDTGATQVNQLADGTAPETIDVAAVAAKLAQNGATEPPKDAQFLPLGVFSLAPENQPEASVMVQLAVSKDGVLRGSYFDLVSDQEKKIHGSIDKQTQRAAWTVGPQGKVVFETALANLTEEKGPVSLHYENGQIGRWTMARFDDPESNDGEDEMSDDDEASDNG